MTLFNLWIEHNFIKKGSDFDPNHVYKYILTDSRSVFDPKETIFVAIRTEIGDGHKYIPELFRRGVTTFIVNEIPKNCYAIDATFIVVSDTKKALATMAYASIRGNERGIVITGSLGKTVTKELIYRALNTQCDVKRSPRSWNSAIGMPLSICDMCYGHNNRSVVLTECGIDGPGQADERCVAINNSHRIGVITPITDEHDEAFPSHVEKIREKLRLMACKKVFYADTDPDLRAVINQEHPDAVAVTQGDYPSIFHALAATVIDYLGYDSSKVSELPLVEKRREIYEGGFGNTIFHDRFTHDPRSLREALDFFRRHSSADCQRVLVLGNLLMSCNEKTIGQTRAVYEEAFALARQFGVNKIMVIADDIADIADMFEPGEDVEILSRVVPYILSSYQNGTLLTDSQILIFGETAGSLSRFAETCMTAGHDTSLEVDLDALTHNFNYYRSLLPPTTGLVAMVKASAYGLGAVEIGKTLQSAGASYLAVAVIDEGVQLRQAGITMPVMVLNPITNRYPALFAHKLEPAVFSPDELSRLIHEAEEYGTEAYPVHIKLDTGMHRVGFIQSQLKLIAEMLKNTTAIRVKSVFSHLATADCLDMDEYTTSQLALFDVMCAELQHLLGYNFDRHILNTAGMMRFASSGSYDMARLGIGLYGISPYPLKGRSPLHTVATLRTHIISLKHWSEGTPIGYGCRGRVTRPSIVATIPIGYADGINRHLGRGAASFEVGGVMCPTIGNICMDLCMIDVTDVPDVKVGDSVEIFGRYAPVEALAETLDTIPYEILTSVSPRVKRIYYRN
ncbi:MAG: alanine racemase [Lachnoclostridium sp.]|nr:alanine racemase [Lachnoclostridium sp.]